MDKVLVTGATGNIGAPMATLLIASGAKVRCLVRDIDAAARFLSPAVELVQGDITDAGAVSRATAGCDAIFHAAGIPEQWTRDITLFDRVNRGGTQNLLEAAVRNGVKTFVHVSTQDTFDLTRTPFDETMPSRNPHPSPYERSKFAAQTLVDRASSEGLSVRSIHPCATYGPGAVKPSGTTALLLGLRDGKIPVLLPGILSVVFNADVARGAILAVERGQPGSRFLFSESRQTLLQMSDAVRSLFPATPRPTVLPRWAASLIAIAGESLSAVTGKKPLITRGDLHVISQPGTPSSKRAHEVLGWTPTPFIEGLRQTLS